MDDRAQYLYKGGSQRSSCAQNKPQIRLVQHPCCFSGRASVSDNVRNAKPIAPQADRLVLSNLKVVAHRIN